MLWQHDPAEPVGRWLSLREDASGLRVRGRLSLAVGRARELAALMREGAVDGLSIGFRAVEATRDRRTGLRRLLKVDLWEVSIVTFPMQPGARVGAAKHLGPPAETAPPGLHPGLARSIGRARARLLSSPTLRRP